MTRGGHSTTRKWCRYGLPINILATKPVNFKCNKLALVPFSTDCTQIQNLKNGIGLFFYYHLTHKHPNTIP